MTFSIDIQNEKSYPIDIARLQQMAAIVLQQQSTIPNSALTIVITNDEHIAALNEQFRKIPAPTDVLSFPADAPPIELEDEPPYVGDLVIAYPYASAQAERENHAISDSLCLLVAHGTLHLLGFDHDTPENRAEMWAAQARALTTMGISTAIVPALEGKYDHN